MESECRMYSVVGVGVGDATLVSTNKKVKAIWVGLPVTPGVVSPEEQEWRSVMLTLPAAKQLLVDLRDAVECLVNGVPFE